MSSVQEIVETARSEKRTYLLENECKTIVRAYKIPVTEFAVAESEAAAVQAAERIGYPVVLKILSPDIIHKSDAGGVLMNLRTAEEVRAAYKSILANARKYKPDSRIVGVVVQEFAPAGIEVIIGSVKDPQFGPALMFGLGGIFVEILKDVSFRVAPITAYDAEEMIKEIKGFPILAGARGKEASDIDALVKILLQVSKLVTEHPEISQLDLNPIFSYPKGATCVDARIILEEKGAP
jgi:acetyl-CoA synthetase (ADP-forming)